jgi:TetR/AcrR family transcriptional regulator, mexJK operon transcriptional repressor
MKRKPKVAASGSRSKRESVVNAAVKLFLGEGYSTTLMDDIAKEASVSKATVYSYYRDKASLFADVVHRVCEDLGGDVEELTRDTPEATLKAAALYGAERLLEALDRSLVQRVVSEADDFPQLGKKLWSSGPEKIEAFLARYLAEAHRRGVLDVKDAAHSAALFVGLVMGMYLLPILLTVRKRPSRAEMSRDLDQLVAGFLSTLQPTRTGAP